MQGLLPSVAWACIDQAGSLISRPEATPVLELVSRMVVKDKITIVFVAPS